MLTHQAGIRGKGEDELIAEFFTLGLLRGSASCYEMGIRY